MRTLSLDLRGFGATHALPRETRARGAGISVLVHGVSISTLVLVPLLGASKPPEIPDTSNSVLFRPIIVGLPPPRMAVLRSSGPSNRPRPAQTAAGFAAPKDLPAVVSVGDILDPTTALVPGPGSDADRSGSGNDGGCLLGTLCLDAPLPIADTTPVAIVHVGGVIKEPRLIDSRLPQYPSVAQAAGVSGRVILEVHVGRDGKVRDARILEGHTLFDEAALRSVRSRRYEPLLLNGLQTDFMVTITVAFNLKR